MSTIGYRKIYAMLLVFAPALMAYGDNPVGLTDTKALSFNAEMQKSLNKARALLKAEKIGMALRIFRDNGGHLLGKGEADFNFNFFAQELSRFDKNIRKIIRSHRPKDVPYGVFLKEIGVMDLIESCEFIIRVRPNCPDRIKVFSQFARMFQDFQTSASFPIGKRKYGPHCSFSKSATFLKWVKSMCPEIPVSKEIENEVCLVEFNVHNEPIHPFKDGVISWKKK
jgi:hypothetical protein